MQFLCMMEAGVGEEAIPKILVGIFQQHELQEKSNFCLDVARSAGNIQTKIEKVPRPPQANKKRWKHDCVTRASKQMPNEQTLIDSYGGLK